MKGREFFKESYAKGITPWSGMKRVEELTEEFIGLVRREIPTGNVLDIGGEFKNLFYFSPPCGNSEQPNLTQK